MNVTKEVITDLLPLYYSDECSRDTKSLVEEYFRAHPDFEKEAGHISLGPLPGSLPISLNREDEMKALSRTRRVQRLRSYVMGIAIFFSLAPFSFFANQDKVYWLFSESPMSALVYAIVGVGFWVTYFIMKRRTNDL